MTYYKSTYKHSKKWPESKCQNHIKAFLHRLEKEGLPVCGVRIPVEGGARVNAAGNLVRVGNPASGFPDICCIVRGRFIGIEVKAHRGYTSQRQEKMKQRIENAGGLYIIASCAEEVANVLVHELGTEIFKLLTPHE